MASNLQPMGNPAAACPNCSSAAKQQASSGQPAGSRIDGFAARFEKISCLALAVFSAYMAPDLFTGGIALGVLYEVCMIKFNANLSKTVESRPGCGQGNAEVYMGRGALPSEVVAVTAYFFYSHLKNCSQDFIPLFGIFIGVRLTDNARKWFL